MAGFCAVVPSLLGDIFFGKTFMMVLTAYYIAIPAGAGLGFISSSTVAAIFGDWRWGIRSTFLPLIILLIFITLFLQDRPRGKNTGAFINQHNRIFKQGCYIPVGAIG